MKYNEVNLTIDFGQVSQQQSYICYCIRDHTSGWSHEKDKHTEPLDVISTHFVFMDFPTRSYFKPQSTASSSSFLAYCAGAGDTCWTLCLYIREFKKKKNLRIKTLLTCGSWNMSKGGQCVGRRGKMQDKQHHLALFGSLTQLTSWTYPWNFI